MWWRRRRDPEVEVQQRIGEAIAAREFSEEARERVHQRWPEVRRVAASLRQERERNGFAELFARALRGSS